MTVKECYEMMGANYDEVFNRLRSDERIERFLRKIPEDPTYDLLIKSIEDGNVHEAFRAAHTLKGLCLNFSLVRLGASSSALTEALRGKDSFPIGVEQLLDQVKNDYADLMSAILLLNI